jgi:tRNA/tmRNA/rRNA uracil-C5-methylase (TrmA/RlmC/RlmD family)
MFDRAGTGATGASFAQVNEAVARELREHVVSSARGFAPSAVVDAYAGSGDTSLALAGAGIPVAAIEVDGDSVKAFAGLLPAGSRAFHGRVEDELAALLPADVVLLNPPRSGVSRQVARLLAEPGAVRRAAIYTSCNPATLARDVALMPAFEIQSLHCFDMFPQTAHVETVCVLIPAAA